LINTTAEQPRSARAALPARAAALDIASMPSLRLHLLIGALQGIALWLLYEAGQRWGWLTAFPRALSALVCFSVAAPLAWYLTHAVFVSERSRAAFAVLLGLLLAALGAHAASVSGSEKPAVGSFTFLVPIGVLAFLLVSLVGGWESSRRRLGMPDSSSSRGATLSSRR
jgi:hypothetical protein